MKKIKKLLVVLLALICAFAVFACADTPQEPPTEPTTPTEPTNPTDPTTPTERTAGYKIEYYFERLSDGEYVVDDSVTKSLSAEIGSAVTAQDSSRAGYEKNVSHGSAVNSGTVAEDGTLVLKVYYKLKTYSVKFVEKDGTTLITTKDVKHGAKVTADGVAAPNVPDSSFAYWMASDASAAFDFNATIITGALTLKAVYNNENWGPVV